MTDAFDTPLTRDAGPEGDTLTGPWRAPRQMLADQEYDGHTSVHDDATADKLGLPGAPIEGPTHFSQFDPLAVALFGQAWFERGCISAHFETMVVEGEQVQATVTCTGTRTGPASARARATKSTGEPVLSATLTLGDEPTELDERLARMQAALAQVQATAPPVKLSQRTQRASRQPPRLQHSPAASPTGTSRPFM
jgi:hypothetical protein